MCKSIESMESNEGTGECVKGQPQVHSARRLVDTGSQWRAADVHSASKGWEQRVHSHAAAADWEHDNAATRAHEVSEQWAKDQRRRRAVHGNSRHNHDALESTRTGWHTVVSSQWDRCRTGGPEQCIVPTQSGGCYWSSRVKTQHSAYGRADKRVQRAGSG